MNGGGQKRAFRCSCAPSLSCGTWTALDATGGSENCVEFEHEKKTALRLLQGIELGTMTTDESYGELRDADPALLFLIFKWLRKRYREHPAADGVLGRLSDLCNEHRDITRRAKAGEDDPRRELGLRGTHQYKAWRGPSLST